MLLEYTLSWLLSFGDFRIFRKNNPGLLKITDYKSNIYTKIESSTLTLGFAFKDFTLNEMTEILNFKFTDEILLIGSNFGESINPILNMNPPEKHTNRGRKKKIDVNKSSKKKLGSGKYFHSCTNFFIPAELGLEKYRNKQDKIFKIKVYRTGNGQVPGVRDAQCRDVRPALQILKDYLSVYAERELEYDKEYENIHMRNNKSILNSPGIQLDIIKLGKLIQKTDYSLMDIWDVEYLSTTNASKVTVKFNRPIKNKPNRKTTLKIMKERVNIEGGVCLEDSINILDWLSDLIKHNYSTVMEDVFEFNNESDSSDTEDEVYN